MNLCMWILVVMIPANLGLLFVAWLKADRLAHHKRESWKNAMRRAGYSDAEIDDWEREQ